MFESNFAARACRGHFPPKRSAHCCKTSCTARLNSVPGQNGSATTSLPAVSLVHHRRHNRRLHCKPPATHFASLQSIPYRRPQFRAGCNKTSAACISNGHIVPAAPENELRSSDAQGICQPLNTGHSHPIQRYIQRSASIFASQPMAPAPELNDLHPWCGKPEPTLRNMASPSAGQPCKASRATAR